MVAAIVVAAATAMATAMATAAAVAAGAMTAMRDEDQDDDGYDDDERQSMAEAARACSNRRRVSRVDRVMGDSAYDRRHRNQARG